MMRTLFLLTAGAGLALAQPPTVTNGGVVNGASFAQGQPITPGSLISIFGTNLAASTAQADSIPLSTQLGGVTVQFIHAGQTLNAPMLFVDGTQLNVQVPWELLPDGVAASVGMIVTSNSVSAAKVQVSAAPFSPGIFASNGLAIAVNNSDGTLAWPAGVVPGLTTHPAKPGDALIVYATGLGQLDNTPADGANSLDKLRNTLVKPIVMVGGVTAEVLFSGLSPQFVGVNQVNIVVPNVPAGASVPIQMQIGGMTSQSNVTIAITQ